MSDPRVLLLGTAIAETEATERAELLANAVVPNSAKYLAVAGKFEAPDQVKTFNVERGYHSAPEDLRTSAMWAGAESSGGPRFRDGYDLYCLRRILEMAEAYEVAAILRDDALSVQAFGGLTAELRARPFLTIARPVGASDGLGWSAVLFDLNSADRGFLELAWELYFSGAVYAMSPYSLNNALTVAWDAHRQIASDPELTH